MTRLVGFWLVTVLAGAAVGAQSPIQPLPPRVGQLGKDVGWVPTSQALLGQMLDMAAVTSRDYVVDLGSGDGRTVIAAAKRGARALGVEYDAGLVDLARRNAAAAGVSATAKFVKADLFEIDLSQATVITMYLLPEINLKLRPKLLELRPGTRIVSNTFAMEEWDPDDTTTVHGACFEWCTALMWVVPAKAAGVWRLPQGTLTITQEFQQLRGTLTLRGVVVPVEDGRLRGKRIAFTAGGAKYVGEVRGDAMAGTVTTQGGNTGWTGQREGVASLGAW